MIMSYSEIIFTLLLVFILITTFLFPFVIQFYLYSRLSLNKELDQEIEYVVRQNMSNRMIHGMLKDSWKICCQWLKVNQTWIQTVICEIYSIIFFINYRFHLISLSNVDFILFGFTFITKSTQERLQRRFNSWIMGLYLELNLEATHDPFSLFPHGRCLGY